MKRSTLLIALLLSVSAFAQQPPAKPTDADINGRISALRNQRDEASDRVAMLMGTVNDLQNKLAIAEADAAVCKKPAEKK